MNLQHLVPTVITNSDFFWKIRKKITEKSECFYVGPILDLSVNMSSSSSKLLTVNINGFTSGKLEDAWFAIYKYQRPSDNSSSSSSLLSLKDFIYYQYVYLQEPKATSLRVGNDDDDDAIRFSAIKPIIPGKYQVKLLNRGYMVVAESNIFSITGKDEIEVHVIGDKRKDLILDINLVSVNPSDESVWYGVYKRKENCQKLVVNDYLFYDYVKVLGETRFEKKNFIVVDETTSVDSEYEVKLVLGKDKILCEHEFSVK